MTTTVDSPPMRRNTTNETQNTTSASSVKDAEVGAVVTSSRGKHKRVIYSQDEARLRTVKDVVEQMIAAVKANQTLNLNNAKNKASKKYGVDGTVRLTEIISAVPEEHKKFVAAAERNQFERRVEWQWWPSCPSRAVVLTCDYRSVGIARAARFNLSILRKATQE